MNKKYTVKVNDELKFSYTSTDIENLDIKPLSKSQYHVLNKNNQSFRANLIESDFIKREYTVRINANNYSVKISDELDLLIEEMGLSVRNEQIVNDIKAPMPGLILEINVEEGQTVKEGDYLLVLEAMKMENALTAPRDATIKSIVVKKGETVEKNQLLIEME